MNPPEHERTPLAFEFNSIIKLGETEVKALVKCEIELQLASVKLHQYQYLFQSGAFHQTMMDTAPTFFSLVQQSLAADILLSIAKLYDPAENRVQQNCTLLWLLKHLPSTPTDYVRTTVEKRLSEGKSDMANVITWRHKAGSHNDLEHALQLKKLPELMVSETSELIKETGNILNFIRAQSEGPSHNSVNYQPDVEAGAMQLIAALEDGLTYRRTREKGKSDC